MRGYIPAVRTVRPILLLLTVARIVGSRRTVLSVHIWYSPLTRKRPLFLSPFKDDRSSLDDSLPIP